MANTVWNPADLFGVTLSGANLIASSNSSVSSSAMNWVRAVDAQTTGKFYWEVTMTGWGGDGSGAGLTNKSSTPNAWNATGLCVIFNNGSMYRSGTSVASGFSGATSGAVVCFALDAGAKLLWVRIGAAGSWNGSTGGNPVAGTGGVDVSSITGGFCPAATLNLVTDKATANFGGSAFVGTVPSGFTAGFLVSPPSSAQVTQVAVEQWATTATVTVVNVDLAGNLGAPSFYGKLKYGKAHYSRGGPIAPTLAADLTFAPVVNFSGGLTPTIVLAADIDVHVNLVDLAGGLAPQITLRGSLSLDLLLTVLEGGLTPIVSLGASSFVSGPLWADSEPCPSPPWGLSEPCPPPPWMTAAPCDPVVWKKSTLCNG